MKWHYALEWQNTLTDDEVPLCTLEMEPDEVIPWLNANIKGQEGIDVLVLTELDDPREGGKYYSYFLRPAFDGWRLTKATLMEGR